MADGSRRDITPVRRLVAAVLGTFATFVILFGAGKGSWSTAAVGVAVLVIAIALVITNALRRGARAWVAGTAHVHAASDPPASSTFGRCELQIVIDAPGLAARSVKVRDPRVPVSKWPEVGATLPVMVAIDDPRHVRILWDDVLTHAEAAGLPPELDDTDPLIDDRLDEDEVLVEDDLVGAPVNSWTPGGRDNYPPVSAEPVTADLTDELGTMFDEPVVVHRTPGGPIVVEGTVVEAPAVPQPRRTRPSPYPRGRTRPPSAGTPMDAADVAGPGGTASGVAASDTVTARPDEPEYDGQPTQAADPMIRGVGITLLVGDLDRSVAFYGDTLGFTRIDAGESNVVLSSGDTRVVLKAIRDVTPVNKRLVHLNLEVSDVQQVYERLKARGVRFTYAPRAVNRGTRLEQWAAAFKDPDGHGVALTQWRERSAESPA